MKSFIKTGLLIGTGLAVGVLVAGYLNGADGKNLISNVFYRNYLSVSELSKKTGLSKSFLYKKINNELKPFVRVVNGVKKVHVDVLEIL